MNDLYFYRLRRGWTQQELAEEAGISRRTVCYLERGERLPTMRVCIKICCALGCRIEEVFQDVLL